MHDTPNDQNQHDQVRALRWSDEGLTVLDQRLLPEKVQYHLCTQAAQVAKAIRTMQVRGAPAIGIAAAYGVVLAARQCWQTHGKQWKNAIKTDIDSLAHSRPTAVNLFWALDRMGKVINFIDGNPEAPLLKEARAIHQEDIEANRIMGASGAHLIGSIQGILTHCNTGSLATGGYGTALGVIRSLWQRIGTSEEIQIFATETRPWLQGARLTLWELEQDQIPATLIADSAAAFLMQQGRVQWVVVGADRIAANGDVANKIGTYALAIAARQHGVGFMVVAPTSTIDWHLPQGRLIPIEQREDKELLPEYYRRTDSLAKAWNPVFDITPAELISAIVTEKGVITRPDSSSMKKRLQNV